MKASLFFDEGTVQIVLSPETEMDAKAIALIEESKREPRGGDVFDLGNPISVPALIFKGEFYACKAGFVRQKGGSTDSLIIRINQGEVQPSA